MSIILYSAFYIFIFHTRGLISAKEFGTVFPDLRPSVYITSSIYQTSRQVICTTRLESKVFSLVWLYTFWVQTFKKKKFCRVENFQKKIWPKRKFLEKNLWSEKFWVRKFLVRNLF